MKQLVRFCAALGITCSLLASTVNATPPGSFAVCAACHTSDAPNGLGPRLKGVYGRTAGTASGFNYSPAMKRAKVTWDEKTLDAFIADPQKAIPGNLMPFPGIPDSKQRAEIVEYLKTAQ